MSEIVLAAAMVIAFLGFICWGIGAMGADIARRLSEIQNQVKESKRLL